MTIQEELTLIETNVSNYLTLIEKHINVNEILDSSCNDKSIIDYYDYSRIGYRLFHNLQGAMHMRMDESIYPNVKLNGFHTQSEIINSFIPNNKSYKILELGCGNAFNLGHLARNNINHQFFCVDINLNQIGFANRKYKRQNNLTLLHSNFESLVFDHSSFELIFDIEALCYAQQQTNVLAEIYHLLKPNGYFIQFNGFTENDKIVTNYSDNIAIASKIIAKSMSIAKFYDIHQWIDSAQEIGFQKTTTIDISKTIQSNIKELQKKSLYFFRLPNYIIRKIYSTMPYIVLNAIAGLLIPYIINIGFYRYYLCIFKK